MQQLIATRSNLLLAIADNSAKDGALTPMVELVLSTVETGARIENNQMLRVKVLTDFRLSITRDALLELIADLEKLEADLEALEARFVEAQTSLPLTP